MVASSRRGGGSPGAPLAEKPRANAPRPDDNIPTGACSPRPAAVKQIVHAPPPVRTAASSLRLELQQDHIHSLQRETEELRDQLSSLRQRVTSADEARESERSELVASYERMLAEQAAAVRQYEARAAVVGSLRLEARKRETELTAVRQESVSIRQRLTTISKVWRHSVSELEQALDSEIRHRNHLETERAKVGEGAQAVTGRGEGWGAGGRARGEGWSVGGQDVTTAARCARRRHRRRPCARTARAALSRVRTWRAPWRARGVFSGAFAGFLRPSLLRPSLLRPSLLRPSLHPLSQARAPRPLLVCACARLLVLAARGVVPASLTRNKMAPGWQFAEIHRKKLQSLQREADSRSAEAKRLQEREEHAVQAAATAAARQAERSYEIKAKELKTKTDDMLRKERSQHSSQLQAERGAYERDRERIAENSEASLAAARREMSLEAEAMREAQREAIRREERCRAVDREVRAPREPSPEPRQLPRPLSSHQPAHSVVSSCDCSPHNPPHKPTPKPTPKSTTTNTRRCWPRRCSRWRPRSTPRRPTTSAWRTPPPPPPNRRSRRAARAHAVEG